MKKIKMDKEETTAITEKKEPKAISFEEIKQMPRCHEENRRYDKGRKIDDANVAKIREGKDTVYMKIRIRHISIDFPSNEVLVAYTVYDYDTFETDFVEKKKYAEIMQAGNLRFSTDEIDLSKDIRDEVLTYIENTLD